MAKLNIQQPFLQSSVSHDPSGIILLCWFDTQETSVVIIINVENSCAAEYFCGNYAKKKIWIPWWTKQKKNSINLRCFFFIFAIALDQFHASLLNKSINSKKEIILTPKYWTVVCINFVLWHYCWPLYDKWLEFFLICKLLYSQIMIQG